MKTTLRILRIAVASIYYAKTQINRRQPSYRPLHITNTFKTNIIEFIRIYGNLLNGFNVLRKIN